MNVASGPQFAFRPLDESEALPAADFRRRWFDTRTPVVLRGLVGAWPACRTWSPASLAQRFAAQPVEVMRVANEELCGASPYRERCTMPFAEMVARLTEPSGRDLYLVAQNRLLADPAFDALWSDMDLAPEWFDASARSTHVSLWMSPPGAVTPLHYDLVDTLLAQVHGTKRVIVASPADTPHLYKGPVGYSLADPEPPSSAAFPLLAQATLYKTEIAPGDALFLPGEWWHHVRSLTPSISLSLRNFAWSSPRSPY
jgi:ribosomal protein L16 Arg81 hydroxylase